MSFDVQFKTIGLSKLAKQLDSIEPKQRKELKIALGESALLIHGSAQKSIREHQSSGETYGKHTASKPGFAPNSDTGRLASSIDWTVDESKLTADVGTNVKYGAWLEFGTKDTEPRPWLLPAFRKNLKTIVKIMSKAVKDALK
jgi:HK97 gp10 family phage protein